MGSKSIKSWKADPSPTGWLTQVAVHMDLIALCPFIMSFGDKCRWRTPSIVAVMVLDEIFSIQYCDVLEVWKECRFTHNFTQLCDFAGLASGWIVGLALDELKDLCEYKQTLSPGNRSVLLICLLEESHMLLVMSFSFQLTENSLPSRRVIKVIAIFFFWNLELEQIKKTELYSFKWSKIRYIIYMNPLDGLM